MKPGWMGVIVGFIAGIVGALLIEKGFSLMTVMIVGGLIGLVVGWVLRR